MERKRVFRKSKQTAAHRAREKAVRTRFQRERPDLRDLVAAGEYSEPIRQGTYFELMHLAASLKKLRTRARLSLADMSARTGMDRAALSRLENGVADNPTLATMDRYLQALGKRMIIAFEDNAER